MRELLRLLAVPAAVLLSVYPLTVSADPRVAMLVTVAAAAAVNALLLWSDGAVTLAAAAFVGAYTCSLYVGDVGLDPLAPLFAVVLVLFVEICDTALAVPSLRPVDRAVLRALARSCARLAGVAVVGGGAVLAGAIAVPGASGGMRLIAMAGAVLMVWAVVQVTSRDGHRTDAADR